MSMYLFSRGWVFCVFSLQAEEEEKEGDDETSGFVDVTAPHPEFVLSPPNTRVSSREFEDICEDLAPPNGKGELKNSQHPFLRALRRGRSVRHVLFSFHI